MSNPRTQPLHLQRIAGLALLGACLALPTVAQQTVSGLPAVSPRAHIMQTVGITEIEVDYSGPSARAREIWGALVPFEQTWRAGANTNTTVEISHDLKVEGQDLAAGIYGFHLIPKESGPWTAIFSHDHKAWGSFAYDPANDALRVDVEPRDAENQDRLSYRFEDSDNQKATLALHWAGKAVPIRFEVETSRLVIADLKTQLTGLAQFSWQGWNSAANYCVRSGEYFVECDQWSDRSLSTSRQFQNLITRSGLLALKGDTEQAETYEKEALANANEPQMNALGYQHLFQRNDPKAAVAIFRQNAEDHPDSWNAYDSLAEGLAALNEYSHAVASYKKALAIAPDGQKARIEAAIKNLLSKD